MERNKSDRISNNGIRQPVKSCLAVMNGLSPSNQSPNEGFKIAIPTIDDAIKKIVEAIKLDKQGKHVEPIQRYVFSEVAIKELTSKLESEVLPLGYQKVGEINKPRQFLNVKVWQNEKGNFMLIHQQYNDPNKKPCYGLHVNFTKELANVDLRIESNILDLLHFERLM